VYKYPPTVWFGVFFFGFSFFPFTPPFPAPPFVTPVAGFLVFFEKRNHWFLRSSAGQHGWLLFFCVSAYFFSAPVVPPWIGLVLLSRSAGTKPFFSPPFELSSPHRRGNFTGDCPLFFCSPFPSGALGFPDPLFPIPHSTKSPGGPFSAFPFFIVAFFHAWTCFALGIPLM